jgi:deoxyribodipyrimidine photo-lyase
MDIAVFLFHRDLRLYDNTSLIAAIKDGYTVLPLFIFPPEQINPQINQYFSNPSVQFMCESLKDLYLQLNGGLNLLKGENVSTLNNLYDKWNFKAVYSNTDYSKYAVDRDKEIKEWCTSKNIRFVQHEDYGLLPLREGLLANPIRPYLIFAPFYKRVLSTPIREVEPYTYNKKDFVASVKIKEVGEAKDESLKVDLDTFYQPLEQLAIHGGRANGLLMLNNLKTLKDYQELRDYPALSKTSHASPHLKFGTVSIREMYWEVVKLFKATHGLIRELTFRDFYMKIYALNPELQRGVALRDKLDAHIPWSYDEKVFSAWTNGRTGFPLVDAGMMELNLTGYQHNRIRMLCGSVLTKYLLIDWRWGLKYYYTRLLDADIFSNTAGWGFVSSTGPDGVPYFRAPFNPFIQSSKFDKDAVYIKHWLPELKDVSAKDIHNWFTPSVRNKYKTTYPAPIVDHKQASARAVEVFKTAATTVKN